MSKLAFSDRHQNTQPHLLASLNRPTLPNEQKLPAIDKRFADPSSSQPVGRSYPIPSFFEYRVRPKEFDSL